jgi:predicted ribosome quality control (RQC) complex YloA/Tae2 family protein
MSLLSLPVEKDINDLKIAMVWRKVKDREIEYDLFASEHDELEKRIKQVEEKVQALKESQQTEEEFKAEVAGQWELHRAAGATSGRCDSDDADSSFSCSLSQCLSSACRS